VPCTTLLRSPAGGVKRSSVSYWTNRFDRSQGKQLTETVPDILARIVARKREELAVLRPTAAQLARDAEARRDDRRSFGKAILSRQPAIIAEIKRASPSRGVLSEDFQPAEMAAAYQQGRAAALSVLTDRDFFQGSLDDLACARAAVSLPVLRKDFTTDPLHVIQSAAAGADAILLIAAILTTREMHDLRELAEEYGLSVLVEVHDGEELRRAADSGARMIGVNNRNLHTFEVKLETSLELAPLIPAGTLKVSESGIHSPADLRRLRDAGYAAFLVGEHLMKSGDPAEALRRLCS